MRAWPLMVEGCRRLPIFCIWCQVSNLIRLNRKEMLLLCTFSAIKTDMRNKLTLQMAWRNWILIEWYNKPINLFELLHTINQSQDIHCSHNILLSTIITSSNTYYHKRSQFTNVPQYSLPTLIHFFLQLFANKTLVQANSYLAVLSIERILSLFGYSREIHFYNINIFNYAV